MAVTEAQVQAAFDATDGVVPPSAARVILVKKLTPLFNDGGSAPGDTYLTQDQGDARYRRIGVNINVSEIDGLPAAPSVAQFTIGDGVSKDITIAHNLGTQEIVDVALRRVSDNSRRYVGWSAPTEDTVVLGTFGIAPGASSLVASISYIPPTPTTP